MKTQITFNARSICENVKTLANQMNASYDETCGEIIVKIPKKNGTGIITGVDFDSGVSIMTINCRFEQPLVFKWVIRPVQPLRFNFCAEGSIKHTAENGSLDYCVSRFEGSIATSFRSDVEYFYLPAGEVVSICSIGVDRETYYEFIKCDLEEVPEQLKQLFADVDGKRQFCYTGNYSLAIAECAQSIDNNDSEGLARKTFLESKALELLSLQIQQYEDDLKSSGKRLVIRRVELEMILKAKQYLIENLANPPTIVELARIIGLNQQKLKEGFRNATNSTINKFVQNERLKLAAELIKGEDLDINEVANRVGYANKSFFSKKFKKKFGVLPKHYASRARNRSIDVEKQQIVE